MNQIDDGLAVDLTRSGRCVASDNTVRDCPTLPTQTVTLSYCEHVEGLGIRCPDGTNCGTSHEYDVSVCDPHEAAIRADWLCYIASQPIEVPA